MSWVVVEAAGEVFDFFDPKNFALIVSKCLGIAIICASTLLKVPQIVKIVQANSVQGLSFSMFILELIGYIINLGYSFNSDYPLSTYGEFYFIAIQNVIIIYLLFYYTNSLPTFFSLTAVLAAFVYALFAGLIPIETQALLQACSIPIFTLSKLPQIWSNFKNKSVGQLSGITVGLNFLGTITRIFTTLTEISDQIILLGYLIGGVLNGTLLLQVVTYGGSTKKEKKQE